MVGFIVALVAMLVIAGVVAMTVDAIMVQIVVMTIDVVLWYNRLWCFGSLRRSYRMSRLRWVLLELWLMVAIVSIGRLVVMVMVVVMIVVATTITTVTTPNLFIITKGIVTTMNT